MLAVFGKYCIAGGFASLPHEKCRTYCSLVLHCIYMAELGTTVEKAPIKPKSQKVIKETLHRSIVKISFPVGNNEVRGQTTAEGCPRRRL